MLGILNLMNFKHSATSIANTDTMVFELLSNLVYTHGLRRKKHFLQSLVFKLNIKASIPVKVTVN